MQIEYKTCVISIVFTPEQVMSLENTRRLH